MTSGSHFNRASHRIEAETSESLTAGLVLNFDTVDLGIALDYFDFKIEGEIDRYGPGTVISRCYNLPPEYTPRRIKFPEALAALNLKLWDEDRKRLVPFPKSEATRRDEGAVAQR